MSNDNNYLYFVFVFILLYSILLLFLFNAFIDVFNFNKDKILGVTNITEYDPIYVSNLSNSMGKIVKSSDSVKISDVNLNNLRLGSIYVYKYLNHTVLHRLIADCRLGCFGLIFMGDNNYFADEPINETDILYVVEAIEYER